MKFGSCPIDQCVGALLAHALVLPNRRLKKGHLLSIEDIQEAKSANIRELIVAKIEEFDLLEGDAATKIANALCGAETGLRAAPAFTGRVNLYAAQDGLFNADRKAVDEINRIDPAITLATLPDTHLVKAGRMVTTVKIIPLAVDASHVDQAVTVARNAFMLSVKSPIQTRISLIQTTLDSVKTSTLDKTRRVLEGRLEQWGGTVHRELRVEHTQAGVEDALHEIGGAEDFDEDRDLIVIFGASAITDKADVIPAAVSNGGTVTYLGMPVDPGNLLMVGRYGGLGVIGAPGCARSSAENGFDWVLQRLVHGAHVDGDWISGLGVGGLLMEINERPQPRERGNHG